MEMLLDGLRRSELFSNFPEEILTNYILPHRQILEYGKDICLIRPQQKVSRFGILLSGKVNIMHIFMEGNYSLITSLRPGEILGADLIFTRSQLSPYHAVTAADTKIVYLPADLATQPGQLRSQQQFRSFPGRATACTPNINAHPFSSSVTFGNYSKSLQKSNQCSK